jgi:hypothetical protein
VTKECSSGEVVGEYCGHPGLDLSAAAVHHDLSESADVSTEGGQLPAGGAQRVELALFVGVEVLRGQGPKVMSG